MSPHPARVAGCSAAEIRVFERIALGDTGGHAAEIVASLEISGLVKWKSRRASGGFPDLGPVLTPPARAAYDDYSAWLRSA